VAVGGNTHSLKVSYTVRSADLSPYYKLAPWVIGTFLTSDFYPLSIHISIHIPKPVPFIIGGLFHAGIRKRLGGAFRCGGHLYRLLRRNLFHRGGGDEARNIPTAPTPLLILFGSESLIFN